MLSPQLPHGISLGKPRSNHGPIDICHPAPRLQPALVAVNVHEIQIAHMRQGERGDRIGKGLRRIQSFKTCISFETIVLLGRRIE